MSVKYDEVWCIPAYRAEDFFKNRDYLGCSVSVAALPNRQLGRLSFPQTEIVIEGNRADELYKEFYINFLSGGA